MKPLRYLTWYDVLILTLILFGQPIWLSTELYLTGTSQITAGVSESVASQDYYMIMFQGGTLLFALSYLYFRQFDFKQWQVKIDFKSTAQAISLFLIFSILMEVLFWLFSPGYSAYFASTQFNPWAGFLEFLSQISLSRVLYALLNGVYEELYFLGMVLAVKPQHRPWFWLFSLLVRISFHTYQGLLSAFGIGLILGIGYYIWYDRMGQKNLYTVCLSHAIADVWGLNLLIYLLV